MVFPRIYIYHSIIVKINFNFTMKTFGGVEKVICSFNKNISGISHPLSSALNQFFFALSSSVNRQIILKNSLEGKK